MKIIIQIMLIVLINQIFFKKSEMIKTHLDNENVSNSVIDKIQKFHKLNKSEKILNFDKK
jgi:hypothetical protein